MRAAGFPSGEVAIVGAYESPRRRAPDLHPYEIQAEVVAGALADAGLERGDVEGFCTAAGFGPEGGWQMNVIELAEYLGLNPTWFDSTDIGGAAFVTHAGHAARAIAAGVIDVAVVSYAACGRSSPLPYPDYSTNAAGPGQWEAPYGFSTVGQLRARRAAPHARLRDDARAAGGDRRAVPRERGRRTSTRCTATRSRWTTSSAHRRSRRRCTASTAAWSPTPAAPSCSPRAARRAALAHAGLAARVRRGARPDADEPDGRLHAHGRRRVGPARAGERRPDATTRSTARRSMTRSRSPCC